MLKMVINVVSRFYLEIFLKFMSNKEQRIKSLIIFPNLNDLNLHDFTNNCANKSNGTTQTDNRLCVCAPDYQFVAKDQACGNCFCRNYLYDF